MSGDLSIRDDQRQVSVAGWAGLVSSHEHVALPQDAHAAVESGPVGAYAGRDVVVEVARVVDALGPQGVALQVQRLGRHPPLRHWRRRSACIANGRLGHADEGRGEGSEWLEAGLRGPATSGPGRGSSPGHQRAIAAQIRDEDSHRVDDSAHGSRRLRDGKTAVNHHVGLDDIRLHAEALVVHAHEIGVRSGNSEASRPPGRSPSRRSSAVAGRRRARSREGVPAGERRQRYASARRCPPGTRRASRTWEICSLSFAANSR